MTDETKDKKRPLEEDSDAESDEELVPNVSKSAKKSKKDTSDESSDKDDGIDDADDKETKDKVEKKDEDAAKNESAVKVDPTAENHAEAGAPLDIAPRPGQASGDNLIETPLMAATRMYGTTQEMAEAAVTTKAPSGRRLTFPEKLMDLLNNKDCQDSLCWIQNGNSFAIHQKSFAVNILPAHFEGTKFESFTRKLNRKL